MRESETQTEASAPVRLKFDRFEAAGSLGNLGTFLPLMVGLVAICGVNATATLVLVGIFYIAVGAYYRIPIPVEPFKVIAAVAIADELSAEMVSAGALIMAAILLFFGATNLIGAVAKLFSRPVVRGIQLGIGLTLAIKGVKLILDPAMFLSGRAPALAVSGLNLNLILGIAGLLVALIFMNSRKIPAALVLVAAGLVSGIALGGLEAGRLKFGFQPPDFSMPSAGNFWPALVLLALPQLPLTVGNAIIGSSETARKLFGPAASARATHRALCFSMGIGSAVFGVIGGVPCCHGAGGLAAHYRFGARTGGSNIIIGSILLLLGLVFGNSALALLTLIPKAILGVMLVFAGLELATMMRDMKGGAGIFVAAVIAAIAVATNNMGIAFAVGMVVERILILFFKPNAGGNG